MRHRINKRISFLVNYQSGLAQLPLILGILIMAIAIPAVSKLVQNNQDIRNRAAYNDECATADDCFGDTYYCNVSCSGSPRTCHGMSKTQCQAANPTATPEPQVTATPVPTACGTSPIGTRECYAGNGGYNECSTSGWQSHTCPSGQTCSGGNCVNMVSPTPITGSVCDNPGNYSCVGTQSRLCTVNIFGNYEWTDIQECGTMGCNPTTGQCGSGLKCGTAPLGTKECYAGYGGYNQCIQDGNSAVWLSYPCPSGQICTGAGICSPNGMCGSTSAGSEITCAGKAVGSRCSAAAVGGGLAGHCDGYGTMSNIVCKCTADTSPTPTIMPSSCSGNANCKYSCGSGELEIAGSVCRMGSFDTGVCCLPNASPTPTPQHCPSGSTCALSCGSNQIEVAGSSCTIGSNDGVCCVTTNLTPTPTSSYGCYCSTSNCYGCWMGSNGPYKCSTSNCQAPTATPTLKPGIIATSTPANCTTVGDPAGCCCNDSNCPSGQKCNIPNGSCKGGNSCNPNPGGLFKKKCAYDASQGKNICANQAVQPGENPVDECSSNAVCAAILSPIPTPTGGWNTLTGTPVPNNSPTSPPGGGGGCDYHSLQSRVQPNSSVDWTKSLTLKVGDKVNIGCMHDGFGQFASNVKITATINGTSDNYVWNQASVDQWTTPKSGTYSIICQTTDSKCGGLNSGSDSPILIVNGSDQSSCHECPNIFQCYVSGTTYRWFADNYVQAGFSKVNNSDCTNHNVVMPTFKGKAKGDANCDGIIDGADYSVWRKEYVDEQKTGNYWEADFKCENKVTGEDYSIWRRSYKDLNGGNY